MFGPGLVSALKLHLIYFVTRKKHPDLQKDLDSFRQHLLETSSEMSPLKVWQLQGRNREIITCMK